MASIRSARGIAAAVPRMGDLQSPLSLTVASLEDTHRYTEAHSAAGRGTDDHCTALIFPSLLARHRKRQRTAPPDVSPLRDRSTFRSDDEFREYKQMRRKALERVREFKRPSRSRRGRARPARYLEQWERAARREAEEEQAHQRQIEFDVEVPVGRKKDPMRVCQMGSLS